MSLLGAVVRKIDPKTAINYFRRNLMGSGELGRKQINEIKGKLKNLSQEDRERLRTADLENLTPEEVDLVMFGFVGFKDFGMPNKTIAQMKGNEFSLFKDKLNKIVDDVRAGKTESVEEFTFEEGKIKSNMVDKRKELPKGEPTQTTLFSTGGKVSMLKPDYIDIDGDGNKTEPMQTAAKQRDMKVRGGLLDDDREQYIVGGIASRILRLMSKQKKIKKELDTENMSKPNRVKAEKELDRLQKEIDAGTASESSAAIQGEMAQTADQLKQRGFSPERIDELLEEAFELRNYEELERALSQPILKAEGGNIDGQMAMLMIPKEPEEDMMPEEEMLPDDEMEDEYLDFILDEALDNEEEDYLMSQLQDNDRLSEIFDKVIDVAQEFAGSGPVEGPGSGVSDSIPARLSDGEFVFTAKAVEEIGADNLMAMMKDAEMMADNRQGLAEGGQPEEEETVVMPVEQPASQQDIRVTKTTVGSQASQQEVNDLVDDEVKKSMLRGSRNLG